MVANFVVELVVSLSRVLSGIIVPFKVSPIYAVLNGLSFSRKII